MEYPKPAINQSLSSSNTSNSYQNEAGITLAEGFVSVEWNDNDSLILGLTVSSRLLVWSSTNGNIQFDKIIGNNPVPLTWLASGNLSTGNAIYNLTSQQFQQLNIPEPAISLVVCCIQVQ